MLLACFPVQQLCLDGTWHENSSHAAPASSRVQSRGSGCRAGGITLLALHAGVLLCAVVQAPFCSSVIQWVNNKAEGVLFIACVVAENDPECQGARSCVLIR